MAEEDVKKVSSVHNVHARAPPFGSRYLTDESDVWSKNAWDHVPPPDDQSELIAAALARQRLAPVPEADRRKLNEKPAKHWDNFYKMNAANFFRDRKWLHLEFPELVATTKPNAGPKRVLEIGCGAGNSVFPLLSANENPDLDIRAVDYSGHAVKLVQTNPLYLNPPVGTIIASVWDLSSRGCLPTGIEPDSVDIIILVFVLSALHPDEWHYAISNIYRMLKPGGLVVMRDYGRYDLTQIRAKGGRLLDENFYIRGDKTRVYFFELDELARLFTGSKATASQVSELNLHGDGETLPDEGTEITVNDLPIADASVDEQPAEMTNSAVHHPTLPQISPVLDRPLPDGLKYPLFSIEQLGVDRRLLVNRKRQLKMYRVWMQGQFRKPVES